MLKVVDYIEEHGLEKTVEDFSLSMNDYGHKVILKYSQIDSPMEYKEVRECRGLILEKGTWRVLSYPFKRFFNHGEQYADKVDWDNAHILQKVDGSLIQMYVDPVKDKWCVGTSGTAEAEGPVNDGMEYSTFADLFWDVFNKKECDLKNFTKGYTYVFELTSPYNIIVKPHKYSDLTLLTVRDLTTLEEFQYDDIVDIGERIGIGAVDRYELGDVHDTGRLLRELDGWKWDEEGFVVVDREFRRIKVKNPDYIACHHLKSRLGEHHIMEIIKTNEVDEFISTFPEREQEIYDFQSAYHDLVEKLQKVYDEADKPKNISSEERKKFAISVKEKAKEYDVQEFVGAMFGVQDRKFDSIKDFLSNMDNKKLYQKLKTS